MKRNEMKLQQICESHKVWFQGRKVDAVEYRNEIVAYLETELADRRIALTEINSLPEGVAEFNILFRKLSGNSDASYTTKDRAVEFAEFRIADLMTSDLAKAVGFSA